jgi:hypothetical protein
MVKDQFNLGFYFQLEDFPEIKSNKTVFFVQVTEQPPQSIPYFTIGPSESYTINAGSSQDL